MGFFHQSLIKASAKIKRNKFDSARVIVSNHFFGKREKLLIKLGELKKEIDDYFTSLNTYLKDDRRHSYYTPEARIAEKGELLQDLDRAKAHIKKVERLLQKISAEAKLEE